MTAEELAEGNLCLIMINRMDNVQLEQDRVSTDQYCLATPISLNKVRKVIYWPYFHTRAPTLAWQLCSVRIEMLLGKRLAGSVRLWPGCRR